MSRARDMANLGSQAESGLDASDITTGTLGNTVQDNITRLGVVTTGTFNGTVGSSATFPNGTLVKSEFYKYTDGDKDTTSETLKAVRNYQSFSCTVGNTIIFQWNFLWEAFGNGQNTGTRRGIATAYQSTSAVSEDATSLGTALNEMVIGRILTGNSSAGVNGYIPTLIQGSFVATNTTHYLGLASKTLADVTVTCRVTQTSNRPNTLSIFEYKGDVLT